MITSISSKERPYATKDHCIFLWQCSTSTGFPVLKVNPEFDVKYLPIRFQVIEERSLQHIANLLACNKDCYPSLVIVSATTESKELDYWLSEFLDYLVETKSELLSYIDYDTSYIKNETI